MCSKRLSFYAHCATFHTINLCVSVVSISKIFREFNFRCRLDQRKYFNTELFPIYSIIERDSEKMDIWKDVISLATL